ncbi:MAG: phosphatase domain-containing protein [Vulcanimicrobiota bacterium]
MLSHLGEMDAEALNGWIEHPDFPKTFDRLSSSAEKTLLKEVIRPRVQDLSVRSRGLLIKAMQVGPTYYHREKAIRDIMLATHGHDLTVLKRHIDRGNDHRDLAQLLFHDIDRLDYRRQILEHINREGQLHPCSEVRIISDLDDTIYCNWADKRYPPKTVYPGVLQLHQELRGDVVVLTGRVGDRSGFFENRYRKRLGALGVKEITILTGTLVHQFVHPWIFSKKWANLERHYRLFPEMRVVMFGDTGQADPEFLSKAARHYGVQVAKALLHNVKELTPARRELCDRSGVALFDTYVGAALLLYREGLLSPGKLLRVMQAARTDLDKIVFPRPEIRQARQRELERDLESAQAQLDSA